MSASQVVRAVFQGRATRLTASVLGKADVALLVVDAREGVLPEDEALATWLRGATRGTLLLAANKCERRGKGNIAGTWRLEASICHNRARGPRCLDSAMLRPCCT